MEKSYIYECIGIAWELRKPHGYIHNALNTYIFTTHDSESKEVEEKDSIYHPYMWRHPIKMLPCEIQGILNLGCPNISWHTRSNWLRIFHFFLVKCAPPCSTLNVLREIKTRVAKSRPFFHRKWFPAWPHSSQALAS